MNKGDTRWKHSSNMSNMSQLNKKIMKIFKRLPSENFMIS